MKLLKKSVMVRGIADVALIGCTSRGVSRCPLNLRFQRAYLWYVCALASVLLFVDLDAASSARFTHLSVEQGLSQSTVQAVLQDHIGFLWFGTEEGLNRYDGYTFVVFKHDPQDPKSLPDDIISVLYEDRKQQLWVGTEQGICLFGTLWVAVEGGGLFLRNPVTGVLASFQPDPRNPASLVSFEVTAMLVDHSSRLWVGTLNAGVDLFEPNRQNGTFIHHHHDPKDPKSLSHDEVWGLAEDKVGNLWVATYGGGLNVLDPKTGVFRHYRYQQGNPHSLPTDLLTCVFVDRSGRLWVGTDGAGVLQYDAASDRFLALSHDPSDPASLSQNVVRTIYDDIQGQIWVGTFLGGANLLKKPRRAFGYFNHSAMDPSSLSDPAVASFLEDTEGHIWLGTERGGLDRFDAQTETFIHYRFPASIPGGAAVMSLFQDRRGRIWIGTYRGGLGRFDPQGGKFVVYTHQPGNPKSLGNNEVWAIAENIDGGLWLGTNGGLDRFDTEQGIVTEHFKAPGVGGLVSVGVRSLLLDRQGDLWVGSFGGLNLLRRGSSRFVLYQHKDGDPHTLSNDAVVALYEDRKGWLWAGTLGGGLNRLDRATGEFISYKGFPSNVINGIQEDSSGRLWLSTNHGMSRFNPAIGSVENFDLTNGLQSLQFHLGASLRTRGGHILFGSTDGFYDFDPEAIKPDTYAP
ncbi:MAG: GGDEF domain-containing protein, partial [Ignavibacteriales bacterium]|nr:GGDEF domain-containing protein [Ignavibacteriales bacterium]